MPDQILSQEEIDALLSAMDRGDVDLEQSKGAAAEAVPYNLTSQNIMPQDQFSALAEVYDKFAALLNGSLSSLLQRVIEVEFASTEMVKYEECINAFATPTSFNIFTMEPLIGSGAAGHRAGAGVFADRLHVRRQGQAGQPHPGVHPARAAHDHQAGNGDAQPAAEGLGDRAAG